MRALDGREGIVELAGHYPMSFAAVQKHVAVLERAGLITRRLGRRKIVRTSVEGLQRLGACSTSTRRCGRTRRAHSQSHHQRQGGRNMTVTAVRKDPEALSMTLVAEFDVSPTRV